MLVAVFVLLLSTTVHAATLPAATAHDEHHRELQDTMFDERVADCAASTICSALFDTDSLLECRDEECSSVLRDAQFAVFLLFYVMPGALQRMLRISFKALF